tara:strand:+ start:93 stop:476 length:384 start_codon:yes stop_codon:yes gene_type:complete
MKSELNLFGNSGFQKPQELTSMEDDKKIVDKTIENKKDLTLGSEKDASLIDSTLSNKDNIFSSKKSKKRLKKKYKLKYSGHELFSFLLASAIIALVIWFFVLKKTIVSTVTENVPSAFKLNQQYSNE